MDKERNLWNEVGNKCLRRAAELLDSGLCRYGRDYDLGDVVTVVADDRQRNARLTAVEETYEDGKRTLKATFGEGPVTLTGLIRERMRGSIA